jgi:hypothetical protein
MACTRARTMSYLHKIPASFQHGPDAIASCQEHVMNRDVEELLREMIRLKEILEQMPNAFHSISPNPNSGDNYVSADEWVRWAKMSAPLSKRVRAPEAYIPECGNLGSQDPARSFVDVPILFLAQGPSNDCFFQVRV